jgi:hypothetical protein
MSNLSGDISRSIFKRKITGLKGEITLSGKALKLLTFLDGQTDIRTISQIMKVSLSDMRPLLSKLLEHGIIEETRKNITMLDPQFLGYMAGQLSKITGPIAQLMVEDAVIEISGGSSEVPKAQASELVDALGRQIPDENQKIEFIKNMLEKLKDL